jgi:hypothetical protein
MKNINTAAKTLRPTKILAKSFKILLYYIKKALECNNGNAKRPLRLSIFYLPQSNNDNAVYRRDSYVRSI